MNLDVNEYAPQAKVIFVKRFQDDREVTEDDILAVASNVGELHEISSISVELTVKNSPGTFSLTLLDTNNKFIIPDEPEKEIPSLYRFSNRRNQTSIMNAKGNTKVVSTQENDPSCSYEFNTFDENKSNTSNKSASGNLSWLSFNHVFITSKEEDDKDMKYVTNYIRDSKTGEIFERWGYDNLGRIIILCKSISEERNLQSKMLKSKNFLWKCTVVEKGISKKEKVNYEVSFKSNFDFLNQYKDTKEQGNNLATFKKGRCVISPMDRVVIFLSERFSEKNETPKLVRAFTGVVSTVQEEYSENKNSISIRGEDVTKYLQLSIININPAYKIDQNNLVDQMPGENITLWSNLLSGLSIIDIVEALTIGRVKIGKEGSQQYIDGVGEYKLAVSSSLTDYIFDPDSNTWRYTKNRANSNYSKASFTKALGDLFSKNSVHIYDIFNKGLTLQGFDSYRLGVGANISLFQADFKTRREILFRCAEDANFNFYADRNGDIWFTPQRFNISHLLLDDKGIYIIKNRDIISYGFLEDDGRVFTSVYVQTDPPLGYQSYGVVGGLSGSARDETAILKYGIRIFTTSNPLIKQQYDKSDTEGNVGGGKGSISDNARVYAKSLLQRFLASRYQGQITIPGRVELEPGNPVYIPIRNKVYYVETVQHSYTYGGSYTTTLHLNYGRKPWDQLAELLTYSERDDVFLSDGYLYTDIVEKDVAKEGYNITTDSNEIKTYFYDVLPTDMSYYNNDKRFMGNSVLVNALERVKKAIDNYRYTYPPGYEGIIIEGREEGNPFKVGLIVNKIYRSYKEQERLYNTLPKGQAAKPGTSLHEKGLAVDISKYSCDGDEGLLVYFLTKEGFIRPFGDNVNEKHHWILSSSHNEPNAFPDKDGNIFL